MGKRKKTYPSPMIIGKETFGQRLAGIRKKKGYTQARLAEKMGIVQGLVSDYERDKLRPYHEIIASFAQVLGVSADTLLGIDKSESKEEKQTLKIQRRLKKIESFPPSMQKVLLRSIDLLLKGAEK